MSWRERDIDRVLGGGIIEQRGDHLRIVVRSRQPRVLLGLHRHRERLRLDQVARRVKADHLLERAARRLQVAFGGLPLRRRAGQRRLGLRHVGAGDLADPEPVVGRLELLGQHLLVVDRQAPATVAPG